MAKYPAIYARAKYNYSVAYQNFFKRLRADFLIGLSRYWFLIKMSEILIVGSVSFDTLHIAGQTYQTIGGAGLYTALAAAHSGGTATLLAPRPCPMPEILQPITERVKWIGPSTLPQHLSRLEIAHHGDGRATLLGASWGATEQLAPVHLPLDLSAYQFVHIAALPTAHAQLDFLRACRQRKANQLSVGTYAKVVYDEKAVVRLLLNEADLFFMNENELLGLYDSLAQIPGTETQLRFVTLDKDGAFAVRRGERLRVHGQPVVEVDPTGAGDTFCGATLAALGQGLKLEVALNEACVLAAQTIQGIGPEKLLDS